MVEIIQEFNEENKDLHKRIKEKAVNTSDFGVQAELPPLDAAPPHGAPDVAADKAPSAAPDAPLSPSQAATDEAPLSPPPQVPPQARQRRVPNIRRTRAHPPYKFKKRRNNPVPLDDIASTVLFLVFNVDYCLLIKLISATCVVILRPT
ncbi:hypothetical protein HNY73_014231 [Argiope bruennichi]|uniref:Uncharacterized protein n=1 Tax=Argiope bruennichi TaxID=94029 RepID=A0A8T0ENC0_ARGBR|nr:hypothetical protein HNY73_014231 [Argiope bruennichi]